MIYLYCIFTVFLAEMNARVTGLLKDVKRSVLELKADTVQNNRNTRLVLFLISKLVRNQPIEESELSQQDSLTQYIPCQDMRDVKDLDRKLQTDMDFFLNSVSNDI